MQMLQAMPFVRFAGENGGLLMHVDAAVRAAVRGGPEYTAGPWAHGEINMTKVKIAVQKLVMELVGDVSESSLVYGFKEIRHLTEKDFATLLEYFPCARFIFNIRENVTAQAQSWAQFFQIDGGRERIEHINAVFHDLFVRNEDRSFWLPLESFSLPTFNRMLNWIGVSNCQYVRLAHENRNGFTSNLDKNFLAGNCSFVGKSLL
jgi:hypothetical protein